MGIVVTSGKPKWCNGQHTSPECQRCGFDSYTRHNISHFHLTHDIGYHDHDLVQAMHCMVVELTLCMYICKIIVCLHVIVSIKRLTIPDG